MDLKKPGKFFAPICNFKCKIGVSTRPFKYNIFDTQYKDKLEIMEKKYYKVQPDEFSKEKLSLDELFAVLTWINRGEHHCGAFYNEAIEKNTFYNLLKRMEEIRNELRNSS